MRTMAGVVDMNKRRLISGWLDHVIDGKIATRWAVLEKSTDYESVTLRLFKCEKEACEKQTYTLGKENFIGTERGSVKQYNKKTPALYWAIITVHDQTLLFQDSHNSNKNVSTFEKWDKILKDFWNHQSWLVTPVKGPNSFVKERGLTLHINRASVCFAYLNPPRHYCRLYLDTIEQVRYDSTRLCFSVTSDNNSSGYYEVKTERERFACKIKEVIESLCTRCLAIKSPEPNSNPHQDRLCTIGQIDDTTGEDIHMNIDSLFPNNNRINSSSCLLTSPTGSSKATEQEPLPIPAIKIIPVSTVGDESKQEHGSCLKQVPVIPPRTTSCSVISGPKIKFDTSLIDNPVSTTKLQKGMSASTGKLHILKLDHAWESSSAWDRSPPIPAQRKRPPESLDTTRVTSAVQLPLPKPPIPTPPITVEKLNWVRQVTPDDYDSICDSMSSIASQNSDVTSMDITQSLSSLSSEEERCRSSSAESRRKSPVTKSVLSLNSCSNPSNSYSKTPGYNRSFSVPTELPQNHHFMASDHVDPDYESTEQDYINVSKDSLSSLKVTDMEDTVYINMAHEQALYVNPPLKPSVNPVPVPPRHPQPPTPARTNKHDKLECRVECLSKNCESMELHEVLDAMLNGDEQGGTMGLPLTIWLKFCLNCDIERSNYSSNNWRGLAEQLGLSSSDIVLVDDYSRRYSKKPTQLILSYWEKQAQPRRPFNKSELISMLHELERQDLLDIVIQREKYTGAGGKV